MGQRPRVPSGLSLDHTHRELREAVGCPNGLQRRTLAINAVISSGGKHTASGLMALGVDRLFGGS